MAEFIGRTHEIETLNRVLESVRAGARRSKPGKCIMLRGRRRLGKSSLVAEFARRSGVPSVYYTAAGMDPARELADLTDAVAWSDLPGREHYLEDPPTDWRYAFRQLADSLPDDTPSVVVLDEVPYLMERVPSFEGILQRAWDRELVNKPVLLLLIGSDLSMMEALNSYERPFFMRGTEMVLGPLNPAEVGQMLDLAPADAFDATLVTGGFPLVCAEWEPGATLWEFLGRSLEDPISALLVSAERVLAAEFPATAMSAEVMRAIGSGERTFTNIARAAGGISHVTLNRALDVLVRKGIVTASLPIALKPSKDRRYSINDPYLRFWLALVEPHMSEIERRRGDLTLDRIRSSWTSWRGRAIEPLIRESVARLLPKGPVPEARYIGGYWNRSNSVEIDMVGADKAPVADELLFLGSIKWLDRDAFDRRDLTALQNHRAALTADAVPLVAVSRSGFNCDGLDVGFGPEELLSSWR
ncbi:DUF234 domain-containing protein [Glycomyces sp. YM15]|uniref:ATP-binding protein n=1 Tax=Glycomyces sp. YM15 TaxID=2800446 RepID=UPI00196682EB|nr:DUF234 domain-containing protein [Glycomyces sp. YM15]